MSVDIRCDECRKHLGTGDDIVCRPCYDSALTAIRNDARDAGYDAGRAAGYDAGYEDGKTAQIFGDEPGAPIPAVKGK